MGSDLQRSTPTRYGVRRIPGHGRPPRPSRWTIGRDNDTRTHVSAPDRRRSRRRSSNWAKRSNSAVPRGGSPEPSPCSADRSNAPHANPTQVLAAIFNRIGCGRLFCRDAEPVLPRSLVRRRIIARYPTRKCLAKQPLSAGDAVRCGSRVPVPGRVPSRRSRRPDRTVRKSSERGP